MKTKIKSFLNKVRDAFFMALAMVIPQVARADGTGNQILGDITKEIQGTSTNVLTLLQIFLGIGAGIALVVIIVKLVKGDDREGASKLAWWIGGFAIGFILLGFVKRAISGTNGTLGS